MTLPPALAAIMIPAGLFAAWLFLHKDADIEQRIDKKESIHQRESAEFDKDFAKITGDSGGIDRANSRIAEAEKQIKDADKAKEKRQQTDQRAAVRDGVDDFLKPGSKDKK